MPVLLWGPSGVYAGSLLQPTLDFLRGLPELHLDPRLHPPGVCVVASGSVRAEAQDYPETAGSSFSLLCCPLPGGGIQHSLCLLEPHTAAVGSTLLGIVPLSSSKPD